MAFSCIVPSWVNFIYMYTTYVLYECLCVKTFILCLFERLLETRANAEKLERPSAVLYLGFLIVKCVICGPTHLSNDIGGSRIPPPHVIVRSLQRG